MPGRASREALLQDLGTEPCNARMARSNWLVVAADESMDHCWWPGVLIARLIALQPR